MSDINPLVKNTLRRRWRRWLCKKFGCLLYGPWYGMAQASCRRCGKRTSFAASHVPEWSLPWGEYE